MSRAPTPPLVLRTAAVWGTTVLATRILDSGQSLIVGEDARAITAKPFGSDAADAPIRGVAAGWELDARGATGGAIFLRGRRENPAALARSGASIPIVAGDYGLVQYGSFGVFFQFTDAPKAIPRRGRLSWPLLLSFLFSCIAVGGGLALLWAVTTPRGIPKPLELTNHAELALRFNLKPEELIAESPAWQATNAGATNARRQDSKAESARSKGRGTPGKLRNSRSERKSEAPAQPRQHLGGMAEALSSDVGDEVRKTLNTISSVADALGGLRARHVVLGQGSGASLRSGGARRDGDAAGSDERKLAATQAPRPGQGLSPGQIQRVVLSRMGAFQACYEIASAKDPTLKGGVTVRFSISPAGAVPSVSITNSTLANARVEGCITRQFSRLKFPAADKATEAAFPFTFRQRKR